MSTNDEKVLLNLKRSQKHLDKIINMVENEQYCIDVIQQINAVIGYLNSARAKKLESHLHTCFVEDLKPAENKANAVKKVDEVLKAMKMAT